MFSKTRTKLKEKEKKMEANADYDDTRQQGRPHALESLLQKITTKQLNQSILRFPFYFEFSIFDNERKGDSGHNKAIIGWVGRGEAWRVGGGGMSGRCASSLGGGGGRHGEGEEGLAGVDAANVRLEVVLEVGAVRAVWAVEGARIGVGVQVATQLPPAQERLVAHVTHKAVPAASTVRSDRAGNGRGGGSGGGGRRTHKVVQDTTGRSDAAAVSSLMQNHQQRG